MKRIGFLLLALALLLPACASAQEAKELTADLRHHLRSCPNDGRARQRLHDGLAQRAGQKAVSGISAARGRNGGLAVCLLCRNAPVMGG